MRDNVLYASFTKIEKELAILRSDTVKNNIILNALILYLTHRVSFECRWKWVEMVRNWISNKTGLITVTTLQQFITTQIKQNQLQAEAQIKAQAKAKETKKRGNLQSKGESKPHG